MPLTDPEMNARSALRRELRRIRSAIDGDAAATAAGSAAAHLGESPEFTSAQSLAGYIAVRGELDATPLLRRALARGKTVFLPRITGAGEMTFVRWEEGDPMTNNRYGIPEPAGRHDDIRDAGSLDLVIVPLLGFDARGIRLGNGAGYYDRAFAFKRTRPYHRPRLAGYAFAAQECTRLEAAPWDVPLDLIATERGLLRTPPRQTHAGECE